MSTERPKNFPAFRQPSRISSSLTFLIAIAIIGLFVMIEVLLAGWRIFPDLVDQFIVRWTTRRTSLVGLFGAIPSQASNETSVTADASLDFRRTTMLENSGQTAKAIASLKSLQAMTNLPSSLQTEIQNHLRFLSLVNAPNGTNVVGLETRDDVGLQPESTLGIIECKLMDGRPTGRVLRVAMKARPGASIDVRGVKIHVYFYEKTNDGEVVLTDSPIRSEWLNPPTDWANGNPQLLDVLYSGPQTSPSPNTFYGYIVGIYYNGELQDSRAVPVRLVRDFPPPLFLITAPK